MLRKPRPASASSAPRPPRELLYPHEFGILDGSLPRKARPHSASVLSKRRTSSSMQPLFEDVDSTMAAAALETTTSEMDSAIQSGMFSTTFRASSEPALLIELERFIRRELQELGGEELPPGDPTRLSVHKTAFQAFIQDFKSYSSVLSAIKLEYDRSIERLEAKVRTIPQLEAQLALHKYEVAEQQTAMVSELVGRIDQVKGDMAKWQHEAESSNAQVISLESKIKSFESDLLDKNERIKDHEMQLSLVAENEAKLTSALRDAERKVADQTSAVEQLMHEKALLDESYKAANNKLNDLKEAYKDTVPRFEHELLQAEHDSYKSRFEQQRDMTMKMHQQILDIQQKHEHFIRDLEKRFAERLRHATPDWDFIAKRCTGNIEPFWTPCSGMNCNETIVTLIQLLMKGGGPKSPSSDPQDRVADTGGDGTSTGLSAGMLAKSGTVGALAVAGRSGTVGGLASRGNLMAGGKIMKSQVGLAGIAGGVTNGFSLKQQRQNEEKQTFFVGLGFSSGIPRYLRWKGRVKNRKLTRKNTVLVIRDVWTTKVAFDDDRRFQDRGPSSLSEYFYQYLKKRWSTQEAISEWGYNVVEACKQFKERDCECWLFLDILEGRLDEPVYHHVQSLVESIRTTFARLDANLNDGIASGIVPKAIVLSTLSEMWKHKVPSQIKELTTALEADQPAGDLITYSMLFQAADQGESAFIEAIKMQEMEERAQYMKDVEAAVLTYHGATVTALTALEYSRVLGRFDVDKSKAEVDEYVARGYGVPVEKLKPRDTMTIGKFLANLSRGVLRRG